MLDDVIEEITKIMADLETRLKRVHRNIKDIQTAAIENSFLLYARDVKEILDKILTEHENVKEKGKKKVMAATGS